jgi:hypothetical protein
MTATVNYTKIFEDDDEYGPMLMTVAKFKDCVYEGGFIDYDGYGEPYKDGKICEDVIVNPSDIRTKFASIPEDATHIVWYNR